MVVRFLSWALMMVVVHKLGDADSPHHPLQWRGLVSTAEACMISCCVALMHLYVVVDVLLSSVLFWVLSQFVYTRPTRTSSLDGICTVWVHFVFQGIVVWSFCALVMNKAQQHNIPTNAYAWCSLYIYQSIPNSLLLWVFCCCVWLTCCFRKLCALHTLQFWIFVRFCMACMLNAPYQVVHWQISHVLKHACTCSEWPVCLNAIALVGQTNYFFLLLIIWWHSFSTWQSLYAPTQFP